MFEVEAAQVTSQTLQVCLYDYDSTCRHRSIGSLQMPLSSIDLQERVTIWKRLAFLQHMKHMVRCESYAWLLC